MKIALTGATGFVGAATLARARDAGHTVRALTRRPQPSRGGVEWIAGALDDPAALDRLVQGTDAVVHVAGVVNARDRAGFAAGNIDGTDAMLAAATNAGVGRFVHVSSLAAREPDLSSYGWSKAVAEGLVEASSLNWTIVRPPAVYGPGDMEMRELFRMAKWGLALLPPPGRLSLIHVDDLARLLVACAERDAGRLIVEPDDGSGGMDHAAFARTIGRAVGRSVVPLPLPRALLSAAAWADGRLRGEKAKLTQDRVAYMVHPDWTSTPDMTPDPALWRPAIATPDGLAATAAWYRDNGLL